MSRKNWEDEIFSWRFPDYTDDMYHSYNECITQKRKRDVVIEEMFSDYGDVLRHVCVDAARSGDEEGRAVSGELTNPDAVWAYLASAAKLKNDVAKMAVHDLASLYRTEWKAQSAAYEIANDRRNARDDLFEYYNVPAADADYSFWLKTETWTISEAVALSLGKDPSVFQNKRMDDFNRESPSPFRREYGRRHFLLQRAQISNDPSQPIKREQYLDWFKNNDIALPPELGGFHGVKGEEYWRLKCLDIEEKFKKLEYKNLNDEIKGIDGIRMSTLYKIILGVSICAYSHKMQGQSPAPTAIEEDLRLLSDRDAGISNIRVSDDKIREVLKKAASFLEVSWLNNSNEGVGRAWKRTR